MTLEMKLIKIIKKNKYEYIYIIKYEQQIKGVRKLANKGMKKYKVRNKKEAKGRQYEGEAMDKVGLATGNPQLAQAGSMLSEGGGIVGGAWSVVEKVRTVRTSDDLAEAIEDGLVLAWQGAQFGAKFNMLVQ